ncbi:flavin reductase family protein [Streptomyces uncialis]|uniref:Flavin reductase n=2 Tax=Streptomyces uncialis TaxID=1048205 RepID=G3K6J8_9ACTN|nr:flavin reductase family protein [Streptomyces uncialis]AEO12709.1 flavin reductase [Streptomyces uncialis]
MKLSPEITPTRFRALMAGFPSGVAVLTATDPDGGRPWGMTCSSVCAVSLAPPTLLVCVRTGSPTLDAMLRRSAFAVNLLHDGARATAELFASGAPHRFDQVRWEYPVTGGGPHLVEDAHTVADCEVSGHQVVGSHAVVFGEVTAVHHRSPPRPLLYGLRRYAAWPLPDVDTVSWVAP